MVIDIEEVTQLKQKKFIIWLALNILLPLIPVFIKLAITFFADSNKIVVTILDSVELIYFNFILCVIFLYDMAIKDNMVRIEYIMTLGAAIIIVIDMILLMLIYGGQGELERIRYASVIISFLVPCVVIANKWREQEVAE